MDELYGLAIKIVSKRLTFNKIKIIFKYWQNYCERLEK